MSDDQPALNDIPVVVSLTTIRSRLPKLHHVLRSLVEQKVKPEKIYLVVSREPRYLDEGVSIDDLPEKVAAMVEAGVVSIIEAPNDGPYRKLMPVLRMYQGTDMLIATADDDSVYPVDWLSSLLQGHMKQSTAIIAHTARAMPVRRGKFRAYPEWKALPTAPETFCEVAEQYWPLFTLPVGKGGVLYPNDALGNPDLLDALQQAAPLQDDLAFKAASMVREVPVYTTADLGVTSQRPSPLATGPQLFDSNHRANSTAWSALLEVMVDRSFDVSKYLSGQQQSAG